MNNSENPLDKLFVSESQSVDKQELASLLLPYISINKETGAIDFSSEFMNLSNPEKILIILAAIKARSLVSGTEDKISPSDIIKMEVAPEGSIKSALKALSDSKDIKSEKGKYSLPNYKLSQTVARFKKEKK